MIKKKIKNFEKIFFLIFKITSLNNLSIKKNLKIIDTKKLNFFHKEKDALRDKLAREKKLIF